MKKILRFFAALAVLALVYTSAHALTFTPVYPWMMFHDWSNHIYEQGYTPTERQQIADCNVGLWDIRYLLTPRGQTEIAAIKVLNTEFLVMAYYKHTHIPEADISANFPFWSDYDDLMDDNEAELADGACAPAWPAPPSVNDLNHWMDLLPATGGDTYDKVLSNSVTDLWATYLADTANYPHMPDLVQIDYVYVKTQGYWIWPGDSAAHGNLDMDQDATDYASDADELLAFKDFQEDFMVNLQTAMGDSFVIVLNGTGTYFTKDWATLADDVAGQIYEDFPNFAAQTNTSRVSIDIVNDGFVGPWYGTARRARNWYFLFLSGGSDLDTTAPNSKAMAARVASLIWQQPWSMVYSANPGHVFVDPHQSVFVDAGVPTGVIVETALGDGGVSFERAFEGGDAYYAVAGDDQSITALWTPTPVPPPANNRPSAVDDDYVYYTVAKGAGFGIGDVDSGVLANDFDLDGDALTAVLAPGGDAQQGALVLNSNGTFTYVHNDGAGTSDRFAYNANDGTINSGHPADVTITITPSTGTDPPDNPDPTEVPDSPIFPGDPDPGQRRWEWHDVDPSTAPTLELTVTQRSHLYIFVRGEIASGTDITAHWRPPGRPVTDEIQLEFLPSGGGAADAPVTDLLIQTNTAEGRYMVAVTNTDLPLLIFPGEIRIIFDTTGGGPFPVFTATLIAVGPSTGH